MNIPELLLPAGSLDSGLAAFEGGADAVYLGFAEFSARKQARNFSRDDYRRILRSARGSGRRVYVTINTVLLDSEFPALVDLLCFLDHFRPDAVLFQDWGVASIIHQRFPAIKLHASTQTAMQGPAAARLALECGVSRLVLPRECGLAELRELRAAVPELEYEVFVHGALCYSYSGLCLASGLLLGRSGNRGECAQLCRSYCHVDSVIATGTAGEAAAVSGSAALPALASAAQIPPALSPESLVGRDGYWFSCRDLSLVDSLRELAEAGAASLKVEGRMKAPEYTYAVARLYRAALDRLAGLSPASSAPTLDELKLNARLAFSRQQTDAYLRDPRGRGLIDSGYPGHRGVPAGTLVACSREGEGWRATIELSLPLGLHDGIAVYPPAEPGKPGIKPAPIAFPVSGLADSRSGKPLVHARPGGRVDIDAPRRLEPGSLLARVSARELDRRAAAPEEFPPALRQIGAEVSFAPAGPDSPGAQVPVPENGGRGILCLRLNTERGSIDIKDSEALPLERARSAGGFEKALSRFSENGGQDFVLAARTAPGAVFALGSCGSVPAADLFVPPSALKAAKNRLYEAAAAALAREDAATAAEALSSVPGAPAPSGPAPLPRSTEGPLPALPRAKVRYPHPALAAGLPYISPRFLAASPALSLPLFQGRAYMALAPLVADRPAYEEAVKKRILAELDGSLRAAEGRSQDIVLGLDSFHHIAFARSLLAECRSARQKALAEGKPFGRLSFFIDCHLYAANRYSRGFFARLLPDVDFSYEYLEMPGHENGDCPDLPPVMPIGDGFSPPLFLSRGCFIRHNLGSGSCPPSCGRSLALRLSDRDRHYVLLVEDCITMLFRVED